MLNGPLINIGRRSTARCHNRFQQTHSFKPEYANIPLYKTHWDTINRKLCVITAALYNCDSIKSNYFAYKWYSFGLTYSLCSYIYIYWWNCSYRLRTLFFKVIFEYATFCEHFMLLFYRVFYQFMDVLYPTYRVSLILLFVTAKTCQSIIYIIIATKHINRFTFKSFVIYESTYNGQSKPEAIKEYQWLKLFHTFVGNLWRMLMEIWL